MCQVGCNNIVIEEQQQYLKQLEDLMIDKDTVGIRYRLVGPPGVGKTTKYLHFCCIILDVD